MKKFIGILLIVLIFGLSSTFAQEPEKKQEGDTTKVEKKECDKNKEVVKEEKKECDKKKKEEAKDEDE